MANWCTYLQGSSNFWCEKTGQYPSYDMINTYCKNGGYGCSHYYISTCVGVILKKCWSDKTFKNIEDLRKELNNDESYANYLSMYDSIGPVISGKINHDIDKIELSENKLYKIMNKVSKFVEEGKYDRATLYYSKMVLALVKKYRLTDFYNAEADFINKTNKDAKKVQKLTKTLEK